MRVGQIIEYAAAFYPRWNSELATRLMHEWELSPRDGVLVVGERNDSVLVSRRTVGPGPTQLETWLTDKNGTHRGAFFATVERLPE